VGAGRTQCPCRWSSGYNKQESELHYQGYKNLYELLSEGGKTDPLQQLPTLSAINRETAGNVQNINTAQGRSGYTSGLMAALGGADESAGQQKKAEYLTEQTKEQEERKRKDMLLFLDLMLQPGLDAEKLATAIITSNEQTEAAGDASDMSVVSSLLGAVGSAFGG